MKLNIRRLAISTAGLALLWQAPAFAGGGIYVGPNGQRVTAEVNGSQMILISGNGARTPAPSGVYKCATGQHCPGGQTLTVNGGVVVQGGLQPASPALKAGAST